MRSNLFGVFVFAVLVAAPFAVVVHGQIAPRSDERKNIVIVEQPDCPMTLTPAVTSTLPNMLTFGNAGDRPIRAFVLVMEYATFTSVQTYISPQPFEGGKDSKWNMGPGSNSRLYFDYVLFTDGTSWGPDKLERSKEITHVLRVRETVIERLTQLASAYPESKEIVNRAKNFGGLTSFNVLERPNTAKIQELTQSAWESIIRNLRRDTHRPAEAAALADQMEREIPR